MRSALTAKASGGDVIVVDLVLSEMKTKDLVQLLSSVGATGKALLVIEQGLSDLIRVGKNVKHLKVLHSKDLNVYDLLWCEKLVVSRVELDQVQEVWE